MTVMHIVPVERLEFAFAPQPWPFAVARRAEIDAHFTALRRDKPETWNGRVLLLHRHELADGVFRGAYLETDFASFIAWRDWDCPDASVRNCFAMAALQSSDGAFLLGLMNDHTANAGRVYFPCGTPDPSDIVSGRVDLARSMARELREETGLGIDEFTVEPGWTTVFDGGRIAQIKLLQSADTADRLGARIRDHLAGEARPELADIRVVRGPADFEPRMPTFVTAFLTHWWG
jgi:8-oxo-dGTP pyrophosphatase MutT (NUDIX family)